MAPEESPKRANFAAKERGSRTRLRSVAGVLSCAGLFVLTATAFGHWCLELVRVPQPSGLIPAFEPASERGDGVAPPDRDLSGCIAARLPSFPAVPRPAYLQFFEDFAFNTRSVRVSDPAATCRVWTSSG